MKTYVDNWDGDKFYCLALRCPVTDWKGWFADAYSEIELYTTAYRISLYLSEVVQLQGSSDAQYHAVQP